MAGNGDIEEDLEALDNAAAALAADGADADAAELTDALDAFNGVIEEAEATAPEALEEDEATQQIVEARDALQRIIDGDGDEDDVETVEQGLATYVEALQQAIMQALADRMGA